MIGRYKKVINCSKCGSYAVTYNGKRCISIRSGAVCNGEIYEIEIDNFEFFSNWDSKRRELAIKGMRDLVYLSEAQIEMVRTFLYILQNEKHENKTKG